MAVPIRKMSRSRTRHRRSQWTTSATELVPVTIDGRTTRIPRRLVRQAHRLAALGREL